MINPQVQQHQTPTHPATQIFVATIKPFGGIALLTLVEVAIRITNVSRKLNVLLAYMLGTRSKLCIPCKHLAGAFARKLLFVKADSLFSFLDDTKIRSLTFLLGTIADGSLST